MNLTVWRFLRVLAALLAGLLLPLVCLVLVTGLVRTGLAGVVALGAWVVSSVLLVWAIRRRRSLARADR